MLGFSVIGSGSLYGTDITLGPLGVADLDYESRYTSISCITRWFLAAQIEFLGRLDQAKYDYEQSCSWCCKPYGSN